MSPELSVIIPVHNGEKYLRECLDSIVNQSIGLENIEVIVVNDNSADGSLNILNEYLSKYSNFKLISNEKQLGAGKSRNKAIKEVKTDYLTFMDCDDFISDNAFEDSMLKIKENDAELLIYNWETYTGNDYVEPVNIHQQSTDKNLLLKSLDENPGLVFSTACWNKIYHRNLYQYLEFSEGTYDDNVAVVNTIIHADGIFLSKDAIYYYRKNPDSTTENITPKHAIDLADSMLELSSLENDHVNLLNIHFLNDILFWIYHYDWDISSEIRIIDKLNDLNITGEDLNSFKNLFKNQTIFEEDILNIAKWDSKTFLAKYKYFNRLNKVKSRASLYVDVGNGFNEQDKISLDYVPSSNNELSFDLSGFSGIASVRFDPLEGDFIKSKINNIGVNDANCDNSTADEYQVFANLDPYYVLKGEFNNKLTVNFDLIFLTKNDIVNLLNDKKNKFNEINQDTKKGIFKFLK